MAIQSRSARGRRAHGLEAQALIALARLSRALRAAAWRGAQAGREDVPSYSCAERSCPSERAARSAFSARRATLLDLHQWSALTGAGGLVFTPFDADGHESTRRTARLGDFLRIAMPGGLGPAFWVRVEKVIDEPDHVEIQVRPTYDPTRRPLRLGVTEHFFTRQARSRFVLERDGATLVARVAGRHESANTGPESGGPLKALRNRVIAEAGWGVENPPPVTRSAHLGAQSMQWDVFAANLVGSSC